MSSPVPPNWIYGTPLHRPVNPQPGVVKPQMEWLNVRKK